MDFVGITAWTKWFVRFMSFDILLLLLLLIVVLLLMVVLMVLLLFAIDNIPF